MIDLEAVIRHFAEAAHLQLDKLCKTDDKALETLRSRSAANRAEILRDWLSSYSVFQGIRAPQRIAIASAVLKWADSKGRRKRLTTVDALDEAHTELMSICSRAYGRSRDFTSLASKALWLCYPEDVPIFDSFAQRALWVIGKFESGIAPETNADSEYRRFIYTWKALYERYANVISEIDTCGYPYRVRIFDKILWIIGTREYEYR